MKEYLIFLALFVSSLFLSERKSFAQSSWPLQNDSMNLAILILDFQTYEFEKGHFSIHEPCENCDVDSLPFEIIYQEPGDFGYIIFIYTETQDTLFYADIVWDGRGEMVYPDKFLSADSFQTIQTTIQNPLSIEYFDYLSVIDDSTFKVKANSAWNSVKSLDIVEDFSQHPYRIGIYLYPPAVGVFIPSIAKWVVFLYRGKFEMSIDDKYSPQQPNRFDLFQNYPNPFNPETTIKFCLPRQSDIRIDIYNIKGAFVENLYNGNRDAGIYTIPWNASRYPSGIYFVKLNSRDLQLTNKLLLLK